MILSRAFPAAKDDCVVGKEEATCWKLLGVDSKLGKPCTSYH